MTAVFTTSRDKLEAVNRISALAHGGPEELGPGSKERKRVLEKVVTYLELPIDTSKNKVELARSIVESLGGRWTELCYSTGQTITLLGLDLVLRLAEEELARRGNSTAEAPDLDLGSEASRVLAACAPQFARRLDMQRCITEMRARSDPNWAQSEWPGFYFESTARAACIAAAGGGPGPRIGTVQFDYRLKRVWDFKAHSLRMADGRSNPQMILNAAAAVEACVATYGGLGFVVAHGDATYDMTGILHQWRADRKAAEGIRSRSAESGRRRAVKSTFTIRRLEALHFGSLDALREGIEARWLRADFQLGFTQIDGLTPRSGKYLLNTARMPADVVVARLDL